MFKNLLESPEIANKFTNEIINRRTSFSYIDNFRLLMLDLYYVSYVSFLYLSFKMHKIVSQENFMRSVLCYKQKKNSLF